MKAGSSRRRRRTSSSLPRRRSGRSAFSRSSSEAAAARRPYPVAEQPLRTRIDYGTVVFSPNRRERFGAYLDELRAAASEEHLQLMEDIYGADWARPGRSGKEALSLVASSRLRCEHMFAVSEATILHADLDAFYASVEQRDDPRLRGRPVIVGAGVVLAASYEAKAYGVRTAMGGAQARRLCPPAVVVEPRISAYAEASKAVFEVFEDTTPLVEGLSIDEAFLDVRGLRRLSGTPVEIAVRLRR